MPYKTAVAVDTPITEPDHGPYGLRPLPQPPTAEPLPRLRPENVRQIAATAVASCWENSLHSDRTRKTLDWRGLCVAEQFPAPKTFRPNLMPGRRAVPNNPIEMRVAVGCPPNG